MKLMNKNEFLDWVERNRLQDAYKVGDVYSDIPEMLGILCKDGMYRVYQVDERGKPEDIIDVQNEDEAYGYLHQCLMADHMRYLSYKQHEAEAARQNLPVVIVPAAATKLVGTHVENPRNDDPVLNIANASFLMGERILFCADVRPRRLKDGIFGYPSQRFALKKSK